MAPGIFLSYTLNYAKILSTEKTPSGVGKIGQLKAFPYAFKVSHIAECGLSDLTKRIYCPMAELGVLYIKAQFCEATILALQGDRL